MGVTTQAGDIIIDPAMVRRPAKQAQRSNAKFLKPAALLSLTLVAVAVVAVYSVPTLRRLNGTGSTTQLSDSGPLLQFAYPSETPVDRILLKTGVDIALTHIDAAPDSIAVVPPPGDLAGSFTWTVIPHQGTRNVRRLIGEIEWQGRVYKVCEAIDDQEGPALKYAERYFPLNNGGPRYRIPARIDYAPFVNFLSTTIADIHIGQQPVGSMPKLSIGAMAERLVPLCLGQKT